MGEGGWDRGVVHTVKEQRREKTNSFSRL